MAVSGEVIHTRLPRRKRKAGHRSWAPRGGRVAGQHRGDTMSRQTRSRVMAKIRGSNTGPERLLADILAAQGIPFERHCRDLPGRPDFIFRDCMLAVFVDGDFWHGFRFSLWSHKLSPRWREKIDATRQRDQRNFRKLRRLGWKVIRIWEHELESSCDRCIDRLVSRLSIQKKVRIKRHA
jgi:DNA mismatch endonuclease (patch repair protein)